VLDKKFLTIQMLWIGVSIAISFAVHLVLPFPYSIPVIIGAFLLMGVFVRRRQVRALGLTRESGSRISYYCMSCGTKHSSGSCPHCGSKLKKAGF
jgi:hypothetical protein